MASNRSLTGGRLRIALIALVALGVRLLHGPQIDGLDDAGYLETAVRLAHGLTAPHEISQFRFRVGVTYPLSWFLGPNWLLPEQFWILTVTLDIVTLACIAGASTRLWGTRAGWVAAILYATYPLAIQQANCYLPTAFQVASIAISLWLLVSANEDTSSRTRVLALACCGGIAGGLGYLAKEDVAIAIVMVAVGSLLSGWRSPRVVGAFCFGAVLVLLAECSAYAVAEGHPFFRLTGTSGLGARNVSEQLLVSSIWRWDAYLRSLLLIPHQVGLYWWAAIPATVAALSARDRSTRAVIFAFVLTFAYLQFGSGSIHNYSPLPKSPRYTAIATPFLILVVAWWIDHVWASGKRVGAQAVVAIIVVASLPCVLFLSLSGSERARNTIAVAQVIRERNIDAVYTDYYSARLLNLLVPGVARTLFHADWKTNVTRLAVAPDALRGHFVLIDYQMAKIYTSSYEIVLPPLVSQPPEDWQTVWTHEAYPRDSAGRSLLEGVRRFSGFIGQNFVTERLARNIGDMIDRDEARLLLVPR